MRSFCLTDTGRRRSINQDYVYASDQPVGRLSNLYIVADGMGGHNAGDLASRCTVETMVDYIAGASEKFPISILKSAVEAANSAVLERAAQDKDLEGMGTTVVAATVRDGCLYIANVGDSRLYLIGEEISQITVDHSLVEEMVRAGQLAREEVRSHPEKNIITRAVGVSGTLKVDLFDVDLDPGDRILLCTDGLTNMVEDGEISRIVRKETTLESAARRLVASANLNGGKDNISVVLAQQPAEG